MNLYGNIILIIWNLLDAKVADPLFWRSTFAAINRRRATDPVPSAKGVADRL
jgi:hypothetical protein